MPLMAMTEQFGINVPWPANPPEGHFPSEPPHRATPVCSLYLPWCFLRLNHLRGGLASNSSAELPSAAMSYDILLEPVFLTTGFAKRVQSPSL